MFVITATSHLVSVFHPTFFTFCSTVSFDLVVDDLFVSVFTFPFSRSAELCSCSVTLVSCLITLPPHADGCGIIGFTLSVYATNVDAEQV
jgi:hypothetical protein